MDRGLSYGDGLFETMRVVAGQAPLADYHWQRLSGSCQRLSLPCNKAKWSQELAQLLSQHPNENGVIKLVLTAGEGGRGYARPLAVKPNWHWAWHAYTPKPNHWYQQGLSLSLSPVRLASQPLLAGIKHLNRLEQVLARQGHSQRADEVLLLDQLGRPHCLSTMNIYARLGDVIVTPSVNACGVSGVVRRLIVSQWANKLGFNLVQASLSMQQLVNADEVFASNALTGVVAIRKIGVATCKLGQTATELHQQYQQAMELA